MTKRNVLGGNIELRNPNGHVSPIMVKAKMLIQEIWKLKRRLSVNDKAKYTFMRSVMRFSKAYGITQCLH